MTIVQIVDLFEYQLKIQLFITQYKFLYICATICAVDASK